MPQFRARPPSRLHVRAAEPELPPLHVPVAGATVDCAVYLEGQRLPGKYTHVAAAEKVHELRTEGRNAFVWIGLHEPDHHQMDAVAKVFDLHPLAVEDAVNAHQRPKLELFDKTLFLVL